VISLEALQAVGATKKRAAEVLEPLKAACAMYNITTPQRVGMFLAQVGHESAGFLYSSEIWGPTPAQRRYEGRKDLGNIHPGDGSKYRGHGFIQTTGRANHAKVRDRLRSRLNIHVPDFEQEPKRLAEMQWACLSAADYWDMKSLNEVADAGDFERVTRLINGGLNGYEDRLKRWEAVKAVL
jgi:putative chitinase